MSSFIPQSHPRNARNCIKDRIHIYIYIVAFLVINQSINKQQISSKSPLIIWSLRRIFGFVFGRHSLLRLISRRLCRHIIIILDDRQSYKWTEMSPVFNCYVNSTQMGLFVVVYYNSGGKNWMKETYHIRDNEPLNSSPRLNGKNTRSCC